MEDHLSGLSPESRRVIDRLFAWSKLSVDKFKRDLSVETSAYLSGSLLDETFSKESVSRMLHGQLLMLQGLVDAQVEGTTAASAELIRAVLREADRQRLVISIDADAVLNNAGGVNAMGSHGRQLLSGPKGRLAPLTVADASGEAGKQLAEANAEVRRLQEKLRQVTDAYTNVMNSRSSDTEQLMLMQDAMKNKERMAAELALRCQGQDGSVQAAVQQLRLEVEEAKKELSLRLNQSTQYQQVKRLLEQRNEQLRALRQRLARYEPAGTLSGMDDIAAEDD